MTPDAAAVVRALRHATSILGTVREDAVWSANPRLPASALDIFREAFGSTASVSQLS